MLHRLFRTITSNCVTLGGVTWFKVKGAKKILKICPNKKMNAFGGRYQRNIATFQQEFLMFIFVTIHLTLTMVLVWTEPYVKGKEN